MQTKTKLLPYGSSNFGRIMTENYAYVDKTRFIELLENENNPNQFFIRPRKFGKSLFYSMLYHYYDLNKAGDFEKLFGNLYIGKHPTPKRNSYVVMKFDFSGLNTESLEEFKSDFNGKIVATVIDCFTEYKDVIPDVDRKIEEIKSVNSFSGALETTYTTMKSIKRKIFVLVDEYDHFVNDFMMGKFTGEEICIMMNLVRAFYETLKTGASEVIDRIFITGVLPIIQSCGFNVADNLTFKSKYNEMMGFTQKEVDELMLEAGIDPACIKVDMKLYYKGYLFDEYAENKVYNPSIILYFFSRILENGLPPKDIIDENLKVDYRYINSLIQSDCNRENLLHIAKNNGIESDIMQQFSIDRMYDDQYFVSLLVYTGLLTIDKVENGSLRLKIPNYSIQTMFWDYIAKLTVGTNER
jgi:hypothetical protein